jgi:DNA primase
MKSIDYVVLRKSVSIRQVLELIDFKPTHQRGDQWRGPCPFCSELPSSDRRCFSANLRRNLFQCFRCGRSGNVLDLWVEFSGLDLYRAALDLCRQLNISPPIANRNLQPRNSR